MVVVVVVVCILQKTATVYFGNVFYSDHNSIALVLFHKSIFVLTLMFPLDAGFTVAGSEK